MATNNATNNYTPATVAFRVFQNGVFWNLIAAPGYDSYAAEYSANSKIQAFNTTAYDTHTAYSTVTGLFTAPASGIYHFDATLRVPGTVGGYVNGSNYIQINNYPGQALWANEYREAGTAHYFLSLSCSCTTYLNAGETAAVLYIESAGYYSYCYGESFFSGFLIQ